MFPRRSRFYIYVAKLRYIANDKGNGEIFLREVGDANVKTIDCSNKIMSQCLNVSMSQCLNKVLLE